VKPLARQAIGYALVSAVALGVDAGLLVALVRLGHWPTLAAATTSFLTGAIVAYALSVRFVFDQHRLRNRRAEFVGFIALGGIGVIVNGAVMYTAVDLLAIPVLAAKAVAAGFSFGCNFLARRQLLFVQRPPI
jgi:putative flippase GtrA